MARAPTTSFEDLGPKYKSLKDAARSISPRERDAAVEAWRKAATQVAGESFSTNRVMSQDTEKLFTRLHPMHIGKLIMFFYDPKHKATLPYYDRCPLIIPLSMDTKGYLGMNFHYLSPYSRAILMDYLLQDADYSWFRNPPKTYNAFARTRINMTYQKLQQIAGTTTYRPCIKRYLWGHVRSRFYMVAPEDWTSFLALPFEDFAKQSKQTVWTKSLEKALKDAWV